MSEHFFKAWIACKVRPGDNPFTVRDQLAKHEAVGMIFCCMGPYEIRMLVALAGPDQIAEFITNHVHRFAVVDSETVLVVGEENGVALHWLAEAAQTPPDQVDSQL